MNDIFNTVPGAEMDNGAEVALSTPSKEAKTEKLNMMKESFRQTVSSDPDFVKRIRTLSDSLEVVNSLGWSDVGGIVVDKAKNTKEERALAVTSAIVGYRLANIGTEPIKYMTEIWAQGEDGIYVPTKTEKVLLPGTTADLNRQYMPMLCAQAEISFQISNGKIIQGSGAKGNTSVKSLLESFYFSFNKDANGVKKQINDDDVKLNVGEKIGDKWVVKAEFIETFGYLNNPKKDVKKAAKPAGEKFNAQDISANFILKMIEKESM